MDLRRTCRIGIRIDETVKEVVQNEAGKQNRTMSNLIESLIIEKYENEIESLRKEKNQK